MGQRGSEGRPGRSKSCKAVGSGGRTRPWLWSPLRQGGPPEEAGGCSRPREPHPIPVWEAGRPGAWVRGLSRGASAASPSVPCPQGPRSSWRHRQSPPRLGVEAALLSPGLVPQEQSRPPRPATCPWPLQLPQTQTSGTDDRPVSSHRLALCHLGLRPPGATPTRTLQTLLTPSVWHSAGPPRDHGEERLLLVCRGPALGGSHKRNLSFDTGATSNCHLGTICYGSRTQQPAASLDPVVAVALGRPPACLLSWL